MHTRSFSCVIFASVFSSTAFAGMSEQPTGNGEAMLFVLPPVLLTSDTASSVRVIGQAGFGGGGTPGGGQGGGNTGAPAPRDPFMFGSQTNFQASITNAFGRSSDFIMIDIIPDPLHEYAEGQFESLSFDTTAGIQISDLGAEESSAFDFAAEFLNNGTRIRIDFAENASFDPDEMFGFDFTVTNDSGTNIPLGFRYTVPTPGTIALLGMSGLFIARRRR